jgi:hypothetical protein
MAEVVYLRHLEEIRRWMAVVLGIDLPRLTEFESSLCNGVFLCGLGEAVLPSDAMWTKVYDKDQTKFKAKGLDYRHTDNINFFLEFLKKIGLPKSFYLSTIDIYEQRNQPRFIYTLHALSHYLKKKGLLGSSVEAVQKDYFNTEREVSKVVHTVKRGVRSQDVEAFRVVKDIVNEELQYQAMGMEDAEEDELVSEEQDDIYDSFQGIHSPTTISTSSCANSKDIHLATLNCSCPGVTVRVYEKGLSRPHNSEEEHLLQVVSLAIDKEDKGALLKLLQNSLFGDMNIVPTKQASELYYTSLKEIRGEERMPENVLVRHGPPMVKV